MLQNDVFEQPQQERSVFWGVGGRVSSGSELLCVQQNDFTLFSSEQRTLQSG